MIQLGTILNLNFNVMLQFRTLECKKWQLNHKIIILLLLSNQYLLGLVLVFLFLKVKIAMTIMAAKPFIRLLADPLIKLIKPCSLVFRERGKSE